jgi:hypothetical protein
MDFDLCRRYHVCVDDNILCCLLREIVMLKIGKLSGMLVLSLAMAALCSASNASAQKKVSYEQAWAKCKADVNANFPGEGGATAGRYARGTSCMKEYGYRLKKSSLR